VFTHEFRFALGARVRDRVSGFVGTVTACCVDLDGGARVQVTGTVGDQGFGAERIGWFAESRLVAHAQTRRRRE
jgi:hypothetical protein